MFKSLQEKIFGVLLIAAVINFALALFTLSISNLFWAFGLVVASSAFLPKPVKHGRK